MQEGGPLPGPEMGTCLTLRNELSEETYMLTKQEISLGRGAWVESSRVREHRRNALPYGLQFLVLCNWVGFQIVAGQSLWLRYFLIVYASLSQDGFQRGGFWEVSRTYGPASHFDLSWILLVSKYSLSLLHSLQDLLFKITHTSGFYGAWPEQEVSVSSSSNILNTRMCFPIGMVSGKNPLKSRVDLKTLISSCHVVKHVLVLLLYLILWH